MATSRGTGKSPPIQLGLQPRGRVYTLLVGIVIGIFVAGVLVPLTFGEDLSQERSESQALTTGSAGSGPVPPSPSGEDAFAARTNEANVGNRGNAPADDSGPAPTVPEPGSQDNEPKSDTSGGGGDGGGALPASFRGVRSDEIDLGVLLLDLGAATRLGIVDAGAASTKEEQRRGWNRWIEDLNETGWTFWLGEENAAGGVLGRKIVPHFEPYDVVQPSDMRRACLALTEDEKVFAAVDWSTLWGAATLCFTTEHNTPLFTNGAGLPSPGAFFERSQGLLTSLGPDGDRVMLNWVRDLHDLGALEGEAIGIMGNTKPGNREMVDVAQAELERLGYEIAHRSNFSGNRDTAQSQVPVEVQQHRTAGVTRLLVLTEVFVTANFAQEAQGQGYFPKYTVSDMWAATQDVYANAMPQESFEGALGISWNRASETTGEDTDRNPDAPIYAGTDSCRKRWEELTGEKWDRANPQGDAMLPACINLRTWAAAAMGAGADLKPRSLASGFEGLGRIDDWIASDARHGGSFGPGKWSAADDVQTVRFRSDCTCYLPVSPWRRSGV